MHSLTMRAALAQVGASPVLRDQTPTRSIRTRRVRLASIPTRAFWRGGEDRWMTSSPREARPEIPQQIQSSANNGSNSWSVEDMRAPVLPSHGVPTTG